MRQSRLAWLLLLARLILQLSVLASSWVVAPWKRATVPHGFLMLERWNLLGERGLTIERRLQNT